MEQHKIHKKIEEYVSNLFAEVNVTQLPYHNLEHTKNVVRHTIDIADHYELSSDEKNILFIAAWFHDTGYLFAPAETHEEMSCDIMKKFLQENKVDEKTIAEATACVLATKSPTRPLNLLQQIICDADTYHFGTKGFKESNRKILAEMRAQHRDVDPRAFKEGTIRFLESHQYYTGYCRELLNEKKESNLRKLRKKLLSSMDTSDAKQTPPSLTDAKDKSGLMSKGIQTMLRLTSENHLRLSELADHKANILISVNAIIISVILGVLLRKLQEDPYLVIPTVIFLVVAVVTIVISILATRPKVSGGTFTMDEVKQKKINLLFFGNFHKVSYEQYDIAMRDLMMDTDYLYTTLIKDIYFLGKVLGRKYRLVRLAYNIFMIGIVLSVIAFAIATVLSEPSSSVTIINGTGSPF